MNNGTERLLRDLRGELLFRSMNRREKDRAISRIDAILKEEGFWPKLWNSKIGFFWER